MAHYCDPSLNKKPAVLLSVVTWRGETKCMCFFSFSFFYHTSSPQALLFYLSHFSEYILVLILIAFSMLCSFLLLLSVPTIFSNIIFFKSLNSEVCLPPLLPLPSLPTQYPISFPLPCHFCTSFKMTD